MTHYAARMKEETQNDDVHSLTLGMALHLIPQPNHPFHQRNRERERQTVQVSQSVSQVNASVRFVSWTNNKTADEMGKFIRTLQSVSGLRLLLLLLLSCPQANSRWINPKWTGHGHGQQENLCRCRAVWAVYICVRNENGMAKESRWIRSDCCAIHSYSICKFSCTSTSGLPWVVVLIV